MYRNNWPNHSQTRHKIPIRHIRRGNTTPLRTQMSMAEVVPPSSPPPKPAPVPSTNSGPSGQKPTPLPDEIDPASLNNTDNTDTVNHTNRTTDKVDETDWQAMALRARADMDNFRQRQIRRADEAIARERERLLQQFLPIADNLRRALAYHDQAETTLQEGLELVYRQVMHTLAKEGVTPIETVRQRFDPELHEAVAITPAEAESGLILEEIEPGYKLADKLLRPARVVVAD